MDVHIAPELEARLAQAAAQQVRNPDEVAQEVLARHFEKEARFVEAVALGDEALRRGESWTHEQVGQRLGRFLQS